MKRDERREGGCEKKERVKEEGREGEGEPAGDKHITARVKSQGVSKLYLKVMKHTAETPSE